MKIAMWSGPRNLSTAMMYSFGQRKDCSVVDEPFYAAYLAESGLDHPMAREILASQPTDHATVVANISAQNATLIEYQKHMTHHMLPSWDVSWMDEFVNVFLIRHPARVIASYAAKRENPNLEDIGFCQQLELVERVKRGGHKPIIIDSSDIRANPRNMLERLCAAIGVDFDPAMLSWPKGGNTADGAWAPHWYGAVWVSTGFASTEGPLPDLEAEGRALLKEAMPIYEVLKSAAL